MFSLLRCVVLPAAPDRNVAVGTAAGLGRFFEAVTWGPQVSVTWSDRWWVLPGTGTSLGGRVEEGSPGFLFLLMGVTATPICAGRQARF